MMSRKAGNGTAYTLSGPEDAPVVVLVHGLGLNRGTWSWHEPKLARRFRILNYDLYGHGDSPAAPQQPSLTVFSRQLREVLDELEIERCAIAGFSLGGMINRRFALDYPERTTALVILNSPHDRGDERQRLVEQQALQSQAGGPEATLDDALKRWFTADFLASQPEVIAKIRKWVLANDPQSYAASRWVLAAGVKELIRPDPPIACPALVMTCENDPGSTPSMSAAIASEIAGSTLRIVPRLQHMGLVELPDQFTGPMLDFLSKTLD